MPYTFIYRQRGKDSMYKIWHEFGNRVMFLYSFSNGGNIVTHENIYPIKRGALYFISAKKSHYTMPSQPEKYDRNKLFLSIDFFKNVYNLCDSDEYSQIFSSNDKLIYAQIPTNEQPKIEALFDQLQNQSKLPRTEKAILVSICARLLAYLDTYTTDSSALPVPSDCISRAIEYINEHIAEKLTIDEICAAVFMSKYYFCRKFKTATGLSIMEYILSTRLSLAQEMLLNGNQTISKISDQCGFSSLAYFCNVFKQRNGKSPMQYRKESINKK